METENIKSYGKFKSAEELLAAYNALEREFTKRCQLIKELQTANEPACAQEEGKDAEVTQQDATTAEQEIAESVETVTQDNDDAKESPTTQAPAPTEEPSTTRDEIAPSDITAYVIANAVECAELLSDIPQVMDACIAKYKQKLIGMGGAIGAVRGAAVITPVRRPKTLLEAKILADEMLR